MSLIDCDISQYTLFFEYFQHPRKVWMSQCISASTVMRYDIPIDWEGMYITI